jgi:hypothetical protein
VGTNVRSGRLDSLFRVGLYFFDWDLSALNRMLDDKLRKAGLLND